MQPSESKKEAARDALFEAIEHLAHVLPGQAPIKDFVHHNTLHGYQALSFFEALKQSHETTGAYGYMPQVQFLEAFQSGRVSFDDLQTALQNNAALDSKKVLSDEISPPLKREDIFIAALCRPFKALTSCQLNWEMEECSARTKIQHDVDPENRKKLLQSAQAAGIKNESETISDLWAACLEAHGLEHFIVHPEELVDLTPDQAEAMLALVSEKEDHAEEGTLLIDRLIRKASLQQLHNSLEEVGDTATLRSFLLALTGHDLLEDLRPVFQRLVASHLDLGWAALHSKDRSDGLYAAWHRSLGKELAWVFDDSAYWKSSIELLPDDPLDAIIGELTRLGVAQEKWGGYLQRLALEMPGWSGQYFWRHSRPGYDGSSEVKIEMIDYLAVRLSMEHLFAQKISQDRWKIEPGLDLLRWLFRHYPAEFFVRYHFYNDHLPDYLVTQVQPLVNHRGVDVSEQFKTDWEHAAHLIWTWQHSQTGDAHTLRHRVWPLFRLAQHLGLSGSDIRKLDVVMLDEVFEIIDNLDDQQAGYLRLQAYERNYREKLFNAVANNRGRGRWQDRQQRPKAQVMVCMDDREEGLRRHLEEIDPEIETLGSAAYFNLAIQWKDLDDPKGLALCPVTQRPANIIHEKPLSGKIDAGIRHNKRFNLRSRLQNSLHQISRRSVLGSAAMMTLAAPGALISLAGKVLLPRRWSQVLGWMRRSFDTELDTRIEVTADPRGREPHPDNPVLGFTHQQQFEKALAYLTNNGMTGGFARIVVLMGHGSASQNNPHQSAYGCGACSGRFGGPNGRVFSAIVNRPEIRKDLAEQGIAIPDDTWFIGAEHNTCDEFVTWFDEDLIPESHAEAFTELKASMLQAGKEHALERVRRFASAPLGLTAQQAADHISERLNDISQARPELGHACIASAFIGRRSVSRGIFLDRRSFLISYDPSNDADGTTLEKILLEVGPVGAGICLEYYFSTVNNEQYGCGSKITHNVAGLFGVMDGANSDLRTGLPRQMIEIHEPMRLQVIIEASCEVLTAIVSRQPRLQELILNEWILVTAVDPNSGELFEFNPERGFERWQGDSSQAGEIDTVANSKDWYAGHRQPLDPVLISKGVGDD